MSLVSGYELKEFNSASLTGSYQNLGAALSNAAYYGVIFNSSNVAVYISSDGTTDEIRVPAGGTLPLTYFSRHNTLTKAACIFKKGTQLQIKQVTAAGTGFICVNLMTKV